MSDDITPADETALVKDLRKQLDEANKNLKAERDEREKLSKTQRGSSLAALLKAAGASEKVASYVPDSIEVTEEAVLAWLKTEGDVFGWKESAEQPLSSQTPVPGADQFGRLNAVQSAAIPNVPGDAETRIRAAKSPEEINTILGEVFANRLT